MDIKSIAKKMSNVRITRYLMRCLGSIFISFVTRDKKTLYIFSFAGVGDTIAVASMSHYLKDILKYKRMVLVCKENHKSIADLYPSFDDVKVLKRPTMYCISMCNHFNKKIYGINYIIGNYKIKGLSSKNYSNRLEAIKTCIIQAPQHIKPETIKSVIDHKDLGFNKNDIIIAPYANTFKGLNKETSKELASALISKGFRVFTNIYGAEQSIDGTLPLNARLEDILYSADKCAAVISYRSGFSDYMSLNHNINNIVIYPSEYDSVYESVEIYGSKRITSLVDNDDTQKLVTEIVSCVSLQN